MRLPLAIPELGIEFAFYRSEGFELHAASFRDADGNHPHVYAVAARRLPGGGWEAALSADGVETGRVSTPLGTDAIRCLALGAMRARLTRTHRRAWRAARRAAKEEAARRGAGLAALAGDMRARAGEAEAAGGCATAAMLRGYADRADALAGEGGAG